MTLHVTRWLFLCLRLLFRMWQGKKQIKVRFEFLTAVTEDQSTVFWNVTPCSLVEVDLHFRRTCCLHRQYGWQQWQRSPLKRWWIQPDHMTPLLRRQLTLSLIQNHTEIKQFLLSFLYNMSLFYCGRPDRPRPTALLPPRSNGKPEAATAVDKLLMMDLRMPETCWAVFKWEAINVRDWCIWLVDLFEYMMVQDLQTLNLLMLSRA